MWSVDICSFQCLFNFVSVSDIMTLRALNRDFREMVRESCRTCTHLSCVNSDEIQIVTNRNLFPALVSFSKIVMTSTIDKSTMDTLMSRWNTWHSCTISTRNHTRFALKEMLLRVEQLQVLSLHFEKNVNQAYARYLKFTLHGFVRRNPQLRTIVMSADRLPLFVLTPLKMSSLSKFCLQVQFGTIADLNFVVSLLPPTLVDLQLINKHIPHQAHLYPHFLQNLAQRTALRTLVLLNCMHACSILCDSWSMVNTFCETTNLNTLVMSFLRLDSIERLVHRGVQHVTTTVIGCPPTIAHKWIQKLPPNYRIAI